MERVANLQPRPFALAPSYYDNDPWTCQTVDLLYSCVIAITEEDMTKDEALEQIKPLHYSYYGIGTEDTLMAVGALNNPKDARTCPRRILFYLATAVEYRKLRLGSTILRYLEDMSADVGFEAIWLKASEGAIGFYEKQGYQMINPHKNTMAKKLPSLGGAQHF